MSEHSRGHRYNVRGRSRRKNLPVPLGLFGRNNLAVVRENERRADVAHVERQARRVLVLGKVIGRETVPKPVIRPRAKPGGYPDALYGMMKSVRILWPKPSGVARVGLQPCLQVLGHLDQAPLCGFAFGRRYGEERSTKVNVFPLQADELGGADARKGADREHGKQLGCSFLKKQSKLVDREDLGRVIGCFHPIDCRDWIALEVAALNALGEQRGDSASEIIHALSRERQAVKPCLDFLCRDRPNWRRAERFTEAAKPSFQIVLVIYRAFQSPLHRQKFGYQGLDRDALLGLVQVLQIEICGIAQTFAESPQIPRGLEGHDTEPVRELESVGAFSSKLNLDSAELLHRCCLGLEELALTFSVDPDSLDAPGRSFRMFVLNHSQIWPSHWPKVPKKPVTVNMLSPKRASPS